MAVRARVTRAFNAEGRRLPSGTIIEDVTVWRNWERLAALGHIRVLAGDADNPGLDRAATLDGQQNGLERRGVRGKVPVPAVAPPPADAPPEPPAEPPPAEPKPEPPADAPPAEPAPEPPAPEPSTPAKAGDAAPVVVAPVEARRPRSAPTVGGKG